MDSLKKSLQKELSISFDEDLSVAELTDKLSAHITYLINHDFEQLVRVLYRIDVSESKLKDILKKEKDGDAGKIIAQLIIERQLQKIKNRQHFKPTDNTTDEEEKW